MLPFKEGLRARSVNPFSGVKPPPTGGAIVPYKPNSSALVPQSTAPTKITPRPVQIAPTGSHVTRNGTWYQFRQVSHTAPRPTNVAGPRPTSWAQATQTVNSWTPKRNLPLINKINTRLAAGNFTTVARTAKPGLFAKFAGSAKGLARTVLKRAGPIGLMYTLIDLAERAAPSVHRWFDPNGIYIGVPTGTPQGLIPRGVSGKNYQVSWFTQQIDSQGNVVATVRPSIVVAGPVYGFIEEGNCYFLLHLDPVVRQSHGCLSPGRRNIITEFTVREIGTNVEAPRFIGNPPVTGTPQLPIDFPFPIHDPFRLPPTSRQRRRVPDQKPVRQRPTVINPDPFPEPEPDSPTIRPRPPVNTDDCNPCVGIDWIMDELERQRQERERQPRQPAGVLIEVPYAVCTEQTVDGKREKKGVIQYLSFRVIDVPGNWREVLTASALLGTKGCECDDGNAVASSPDWWPQRLGGQRPQIVCVFRKGTTNTYHQIAVPWPANVEPPRQPPLPPYRKGNHHTLLECKDGSKFICNTSGPGEGAKMLAAAKQLILPGMLDFPPREHCVPRKGPGIDEADMIPVRVDYYPTGQRNLTPAWRQKVNLT